MPRFDLSAALAAQAIINPHAEALDGAESQTTTFAVRCNCPACMKGASGGSYGSDHVAGGVVSSHELAQFSPAGAAPASAVDYHLLIEDVVASGMDVWTPESPNDGLFGF